MQLHEVWQAWAKALPVLIVNGKEDQHCAHEAMISIVRMVYDNVQVKLLDGIGQSPRFERRAEVNAIAREWLGGVVRRWRCVMHPLQRQWSD